MAVVIVIWRVLGFPLAFRKGQRGPSVVWIGCTYELDAESVTVSIKEAILADLKDQVTTAMSSNVVSRKALHSLAGRANHVAGLLWAWRPFLQQLWAAISKDGPTHAPNQCIWTTQVMAALQWIHAFLTKAAGSVIRRFELDSWSNTSPPIRLTLDASPWGLGAVLEDSDGTVLWFADQIGDVDEQVLQITKGTCEAQQVLESLCALVALRAWKDRWLLRRLTLLLRGDSVAMLSTVLVMRPPAKSIGLGVVAREIALDLAEATFRPDIGTEHMAGIMNKTADVLSRRWEPGAKQWRVPAWLPKAGSTTVAPSHVVARGQ